MSFILPLHCNSREGFIRGTTAGCSGDTLIDRGTVECTAENIGNAFRELGNYSSE